MLVVAPVVALGFALGTGWGRPQPPSVTDRPPLRVETPDMAVSAGPFAHAVPETKTGETVAEADSLRITGRGSDGSTRTDARLETTELEQAQAVSEYDRQADEAGWIFSPDLTEKMSQSDPGTVVRAYRKSGRLRVVMIGPPLSPGGSVRPVTIFDSSLDASQAAE